MANNTHESAAVFVTADNKVEIVRAGNIRRLISTSNQNLLVVVDERNNPMLYAIDAAPFLKEYEESGKSDDEQTHRVLAAEALFRAVIEGKTFTVVSKHAASEATTA
jgi:hypothetical protein